MEPVTHLLTGACLARTGFHRRFAYATVTMAVAAEFPDIDTLWRLRGPVAAFAHHRGITHTFVGVPIEAAFLLGLTFLWHRARSTRSTKRNQPMPPVRWFALYAGLLLALLSHLLLDYTNNYGLRPFLPFHSEWYAASIVFILDPWLLVVLLAGLLLPPFLGLIHEEISPGQKAPASSGPAITALLLVVAYWGTRSFEHARAMDLAVAQTLRSPGFSSGVPSEGDAQAHGQDDAAQAPEQQRRLLIPQRVWASPDPLNPFRWYLASDFGSVYQASVADTSQRTLTAGQLFYKPVLTPVLQNAERTGLGQVYLNWSAMPLLTSSSAQQDTSRQLGADQFLVNFEDMRFLNTTPLLPQGSLPPLTGQVLLNRSGAVLAQGMDGHFGQ